LPPLQVQKLLSRLISCVPEGAAQSSEVSIQAAALVSFGWTLLSDCVIVHKAA